MGLGTGVLRVYYVICFMRGLSVGVASTSSLFIARRVGIAQHYLVAARGVGLTLGPAVLGRGIGWMVWSGESQSGFAAALVIKMLVELLIPRTSNTWLLFLCYFTVGVTMSMLDTSASYLVGRVYGKNCARPMMLYCAAYGFGSVVSPWLVIRLNERAWDALATIDFVVAVFLLAKRFLVGKPRNWKPKVRGCSAADADLLGVPRSTSGEELAELGHATTPCSTRSGMARQVPRRVLRAAMAFMYVGECAETSVSCWCFTYGMTVLGLPKEKAALLPSAFYLSFTATRGVVVPSTSRLLPSTIANIGVVVTLFGACVFYLLTGVFQVSVAAGVDPSILEGYFQLFVVCLAIMGAGTCPLFATMLASTRQHGELSAQEQGWYDTCVNLGMTTGMWLPGFVPLPKVELVGAVSIFLIINSHSNDFPWWKNQAGLANARSLP